MHGQGTFEVVMSGEPAYGSDDGVILARMRLEKTFAGPLTATSVGHMLAANTPVKDSAGYVALERIIGTLEGKQGSFVVVHQGLLNRGAASLSVLVVPDSGSGALRGISGRMTLKNDAGKHTYNFDFELG
jgi:Protein of unknown function (DUF3224)